MAILNPTCYKTVSGCILGQQNDLIGRYMDVVMESTSVLSTLGITQNCIKSLKYKSIDHLAIAVRDLEQAVVLYRDILGFSVEHRLTIQGEKTGMLSAQMIHNGIKIVLVQGTEPDSQVSKLINQYGPGVAHIALEVDSVEDSVSHLKNLGLKFDTNIIKGQGLIQAFSSRDPNSGMSFEIIQRTSEEGFLQENVQQLFDQLEQSDAY